MKTSKKKWLYRALCAAMAVALVSGTAVMTPIADFVGTSITANAVTGVSSESALRNALASGGTIQLTDDIVFSSSFEVKGASVLDLNGHTLSVSGEYTGAFSLSANLTIKDSSTAGTGTIRLWKTNVPQMFWFNKDVQLNIQSGNLIVGGVAGVWGNLARSDTDGWGTVTISGGNIDVSNSLSDGSTKTCQVTGGTFNKDFSRYVTGGRSMALNANGRWELCRAKGTYWTAFDMPNNQIKVVLKGKLTGMSGNTSTGAVKLDWESILSAIGSDYTITEISAEEGTEFVGSGYKMFNAAKSSGWQSNKLDTVKKIDLRNVNTSQMTNMSYFFCYCTGLEELNISSFDTSNTTSMGSMFYHCHSLKSLDLANFDTSKVTSVPYMFTECQSLESINLSSFDTSKFDALSAWFDGCKKLTVIDMSNFSTPLVEYTQQMFRNCISLTTVFVGSGWTTEKVSTDRDMFTNTTAIVGGAGTVWDSSNPVNKTYAKVDGGTDNPGYLTGKYTVTWKNDNDTILETGKFVNGTAPVYDGETTKTGENGIKYVLSGWNDGTTTYAPDALPAVTGNVTYTAVYTAYQNHDGILFAPWTSTNSLPTAAGNYYLTGNVTISGTWNAPDGINLCLNGYGIRYSGSNGSVIYLGSGYTLNIFDCDTTKEHYITLSNFRGTAVSDTGTETTVTNGTGVIKVNGGYITGGNNSGGGGGINSGYQSANVYIKGVIFIGNKANGASNCGQGSAILLTGGSLSLDGTKFFYNYAQRDGGANADTVCRWGGTTSLKDVDMQYNVGGGINITGGDSAIVSGKTIIRNNVLSTTNTNEFNASVTTLDGSGLTDGSYIGIRNGNANSAPFTTTVATDYVQYFHMDPRFTNLVVSTDSGGYGIRKATYTVTWKNGEDIIETDEKVIEGDTPTYDGETPTKDSTAQYNYTFAGWTSDGGTTVYTAETLPAVTQNVTYTAVFDAELITYPFSIDKSAGGVTFEIADHESNPVAIDNKSFSAPIGSKITSSAELVFDGAEVTAETSENSYVYTIKSVSKDSVTVSRKKVAVTELTVTADNQTYTGNALTPVIVKDGETVLTENTDYTVVYTDNVNAGTATAKITGADTYITGETTVNFTIAKKNIASLAVSFDLDGDGTEYAPETYTADSSKPSIIYDGKEYTPTAKLLFSNEEVPTDSYDVSITSAQNADTYTITFTAKENTNFTGTRTFDWNITKADMNITMTDGLEFNRVGGKVAGECVDESKFAVTGAPDGSTTTLIYFSEQGLQLPKVPTEAGNYTVKAVVTNDNYNDGEATATFTIISNQAGDWYFLKNGNSMLITGYAGDSTTPTIPETINGLPVTGIYYYAFEDSDITSVTIPESVDMIYSYAFKNAKKLTDVYYKGSKTEWKKEVTISNGNNLLKNATIHYALPENIYLDQTTLETTVGKSVRLLVSVSPVGTPADFTWESSDEKVATVDENGNVTTLDFGTATITATADNGKTAVCELTVGHNGSNGIFEYTVSDDKEVALTKYIGTSDTVEVADKIDDMPIVAIAEGTFAETPVKTINYTGSKTMWEELFTGELAEDITVNYALPTSISLDATAEVTKADTITLTPTVTPADTATTFTWTSDDETIATVDENGVVTGVAYGTVDITATADNGQTATCAVTVTNIGEKDDFEYEIVTTDDEDTITITKYNGSDEEVNIPETINGISVTAIGAEAFKDNETMKDVIILLNVETIGDDAFAGCNDELNIHGYRRTDSERYATENNVNFVAIPYPLKNASTISSKHTNVNEKVTLTGVGVEGTLEYTYAVYYKLTDAEKWTVKQNYNANNVVELSLAKEGTYNVCIKVKDTDGKIAKKYFVLYVTQPLANTSSISADTIILGESFTVNMSAEDGSDNYKYAVYMKKADQTSWTQVQGYADSESITVTPEEAGLHNVCIKAKDGFGTISKKYFIVNVKNVAPQNISTISAPEINASESLTIHCDAELGAGSFRYAVYTKNVQDAKWVEIQKFDDNSELSLNFEKPGLYQICVKAKDADNTIAKKYFTVTVTKDTLVNNSTISADEIMLGESIEVNAVSEGGFGAYKYAVYYKLSESSKWTTVQQLDANGNVTITPTKAGRYEICVKVKDETGEIVKKYFMAEVKYEPLVNKCTLSAEEVNFGETLTVTANAENGSGEYKYAVYIKSTERTAWNTVQDFSEQTEINVTFKNKGAYDICIKVMDSYGTVSKTYTSVYVK